MRATLVLSLLAAFACPRAAASESSHDHPHGGKSAVSDAESSGSPRNPESDTAFVRAGIWDSGAAEVLVYSVKRGGGSGRALEEGHGPESERGDGNGSWGHLITERSYLSPGGATGSKKTGGDAVEILNAVLTSSWAESGMRFSRNAAVKLPRRGPFTLLRQDESFQSPAGATHRTLDCRETPPRLRILPVGREAAADSVLGHWPLYTEEMLFTYARALPKRAGYREEIWMLDGDARGGAHPRVRFATLSVRGKMAGIREVDTWHVTVDREGGGRSEFWTSQSGLHPVVLAILADGSEWTLREISRKKKPAR